MLKAVFLDARIWRYVLKELAEFLETVGIRFSPTEGVKLKAMDPSHVMLVDLSIPATAFEEYNVEKEDTLLIPLDPVAKILRRAKKTDKLMIVSDGSKLTLGLLSKGGVERVFTLPLLTGSYEEIPELSIEFETQAKILGPTFAVALSILEEIGDVLKIKAVKEGISLISSSELSEIEIPFTVATGSLIDYQPPLSVDEITNAYSMDYMSMLTSIAKLAETITIKLGKDMPCEISLELTSGTQLKVYIAPRAE
ncbi:MAG: hypothetical protein QXL96_00635 [Ignisphaera sp.]